MSEFDEQIYALGNLFSKEESIMKRKVSFLLAIALTAILFIGLGMGSKGSLYASEPPELLADGQVNDNLLLNGSMEELPFYWKKPNHFVAVHWYRWWIHGTVIPEYDDTRDTRPHYDGEHAQTYFKWGQIYTAGLYQVVDNLEPCSLYQLSAWSRNHSLDDVQPHATVGLAPEGTPLTKNIDSGGVTSGFPPRTVWSEEQTALFVWEQLSVTTEATGTAMTAILYAAPRPSDDRTHYYDSYWDAASLIQVPFPDDRIPMPDSWVNSSFISNVTTEVNTNTLTLMIEWDTGMPASTQVWYDVTKPSAPVTPTIFISETIIPPSSVAFLPLVAYNKHPSSYSSKTPLDTTPVTHHYAEISNLQDEDTINFVLLSRHSDNGKCSTKVYGPLSIKINLSGNATIFTPPR